MYQTKRRTVSPKPALNQYFNQRIAALTPTKKCATLNINNQSKNSTHYQKEVTEKLGKDNQNDTINDPNSKSYKGTINERKNTNHQKDYSSRLHLPIHMAKDNPVRTHGNNSVSNNPHSSASTIPPTYLIRLHIGPNCLKELALYEPSLLVNGNYQSTDMSNLSYSEQIKNWMKVNGIKGKAEGVIWEKVREVINKGVKKGNDRGGEMSERVGEDQHLGKMRANKTERDGLLEPNIQINTPIGTQQSKQQNSQLINSSKKSSFKQNSVNFTNKQSDLANLTNIGDNNLSNTTLDNQPNNSYKGSKKVEGRTVQNNSNVRSVLMQNNQIVLNESKENCNRVKVTSLNNYFNINTLKIASTSNQNQHQATNDQINQQYEPNPKNSTQLKQPLTIQSHRQNTKKLQQSSSSFPTNSPPHLAIPLPSLLTLHLPIKSSTHLPKASQHLYYLLTRHNPPHIDYIHEDYVTFQGLTQEWLQMLANVFERMGEGERFGRDEFCERVKMAVDEVGWGQGRVG